MLIPPALPPQAFPADLRLDNLTSAKERRYYPFVIIVSVLLWGALALTMIGLFYALFIGFFLWISHGLLAAYLRAEAVRVSERQWPELHTSFLEVCQRLGVTQPPRLYVLQAGGALNAFATRHSGRDFVVVYSDFLEAFGPQSPELKFILGHELGHLKSGHILKHVLLAPGLFFPLLGSAYRRSWELSCDRHGVFASQDTAGSLRAMLTLSGGKEKGRFLDAEAFASQYEEERGFFVSLHELTSTYPTLSRRVRELRALQTSDYVREASRNPFAYLVAVLMPGGNVGGGAASGLIMIVIIGLMASMAIPAFQKVRQASIEKACINNKLQVNAALDMLQLETGRAATNWAQVVGPGKYIKTTPVCPAGGTYSLERGPEGIVSTCSVHGSSLMTTLQQTRPAR